VYLDRFEIYREYQGDGVNADLARETMHIMDDKQRTAIIETKTIQSGIGIEDPPPLLRQQLVNHVGSAVLELAEDGALISIEEFHPFGTSAFQTGRNAAEISLKRYRYTGKERDEESGLSYHQARYYSPWLGRWTSCDPKELRAGLNVYSYTGNRPINRVDVEGTQACTPSPLVCDPRYYKGPEPDKPALSGVSSQDQPAERSNAGSTAAGPLTIIVGGNIAVYGDAADFMRAAYREGTEKILAEAQQMLKAGKSEGAAARWVVSQRNALKEAIRTEGPKLFKAVAELRNKLKYGNKLGADYEGIAASKLRAIEASKTLTEAERAAEIAKIDEAIIKGVTKTSGEFNAAGSRLRAFGRLTAVAGFVLTAMQDSPAGQPPLPVSQETEVEIEKTRLHYGIPAYVIMDEHGHRKKSSYLQIDLMDVAHAGDEFDQETEEIMWWLGVPLTYSAYVPGGGTVTWTVPGHSP